MLNVPASDFPRMRIDLRRIHPSRGLRQYGMPVAFEGNLELHHNYCEGIIFQRAGDSLPSAEIQRFALFDNWGFLEADMLRGAPRKHALYGASSRPQQFPKPSQVNGLSHVIEE